MFHINAWGLPFTSALIGANLVLPGPCLDAPSLLELMDSDRVTVAAGVPTVWLGILQVLDKEPGRYDLSHLRTPVTGGSAAPPAPTERARLAAVVDSAAAAAMRAGPMAGISITVARGPELVVSRGSGSADLERNP